MRDLDYSINFNHSRFNSNGWQQFNFDDLSQDISIRPNVNNNHNSTIHIQSLLHQPPRPHANIYNCIDSQQEEQGDIHQVDYVQNQPQAKHVNSKQYFRMMKRRIKKVMNQYNNNPDIVSKGTTQTKQRPKYLYQSRHIHATKRLRGKDGKFLATRPDSERFKQKKKRGRKPKNQTQNKSTSTVVS